MANPSVYVTGAHGFVGSNLMTYLRRDKSRDLVTIGRSGSDLTYDDFAHVAPEAGSSIIHLAGKAHDLDHVANPEEYDEINFRLTKRTYDRFVESDATNFIFTSSVKAAADTVNSVLTEAAIPRPGTAYGVSKLKAENYLRTCPAGPHQKTYILRPCMIHGPGTKGNLALLYNLVSHRIPYPLGAFENKRSLLTIDNLDFAIEQLLSRTIEPGTYNVADDSPLSTNEMVAILSEALGKKTLILHPPRSLMKQLGFWGDHLRLPLTSERLKKLTDDYVVSNKALLKALGINCMPVTAPAGLRATALSMRQLTE